MDDLDREILNEIQWTFPLVQRPYDTLAEKFNQSPSVIKERILRLRESGILRQMSAIFDTRRLGYKSSLVAAKVESDKLDSVAELINKHPGVSHNYERDHEFNLWFTLAVPPDSDLKTELDKFSTCKNHKNAYATNQQLFKIGVKLDMVAEKSPVPYLRYALFWNFPYDHSICYKACIAVSQYCSIPSHYSDFFIMCKPLKDLIFCNSK